MSFSQARTALGTLAVARGEYETQEAWRRRVGAAAVPLMGHDLTVSVPLDRLRITYDADARLIRVPSDAFGENGSGHFNGWTGTGNLITDAFTSSLLTEAGLGADGFVNHVALDLGTREVVRASRTGRNRFGAVIQVRTVDKFTNYIFDRVGDLFPMAAVQPYVVAVIPAEPAVARLLRPQLRAAVVVHAKPPFFLTRTVRPEEGSTEEIDDITGHISVMVADIQCFVLVDGRGKIVAAGPTG